MSMTLRILTPSAMLLAALAVALPLSAAQGSEEAPSGDPGRAGFVEHVEVSLVLLHATVLDKRGETVLGLEPADFVLEEGGRLREIALFGNSLDQPVKIAFLLDVSGSMSLRGKLVEAKRAIRGFVDALQPADEVALMTFADGGVVVQKGFSRRRLPFFEKLDALEPYGRTALRDALAYATSLVAEAKPMRAALILVTDGIDNASTMGNWESIWAARRVQIPIYTIGLTDLPGEVRAHPRPADGGRSFFEVLQEFGQETGGALFPVFKPEEIGSAVGRVAERLRGQYLIGYKPETEGDAGRFRRIDLATTDDDYRVFTRRGYYPRP
jgi:VWFA-related protein